MVHVLAQDLRDAVLQAAMQGKLTVQSTDDSNVTDLLMYIKSQKEKRIETKEIKRNKDYPVDLESVPYDIPDNWKWVRLIDIFAVLNGDRGKNYPSKATLKKNGTIPFISALNLDNERVSQDNNLLFLSTEQYDKLRAGKLRKGDAVICIRGSLGKHGLFQFEKGAIASSLVIVRQYADEVDVMPFLFAYLNSSAFYNQIKEYDNGTAQPNLAAESLKQFYFPFPPIEEQHRIVARIEELMAKIDEYEKMETELAELKTKFPGDMKNAILQAAMEGKHSKRNHSDTEVPALEPVDEAPYDIPDEWKWTYLRDVVWNRKQKKPESKFSYIDIGSINNQKHCLNDNENIIEAEKAPSRARKPVALGDVIYSTVRPYLHNIAIVDKIFSFEPIASTGFAVMSCYEFVDNKYLFYYLLSPDFDRYANDSSNSKGVAYPAINDKALYKAPIPIPPIEEQRRIVESLDKLLPLCDELAELA